MLLQPLLMMSSIGAVHVQIAAFFISIIDRVCQKKKHGIHMHMCGKSLYLVHNKKVICQAECNHRDPLLFANH